MWYSYKEEFNEDGIHKITGTRYNELGYDVEGYREDGYDHDGYDREGFNRRGRDREGYDREGFNVSGFNREGYDKEGYDKDGFSPEGIHKETGTEIDTEGYNKKGFNSEGINREGFFENGIHKDTKYEYGPDGYDINGFNEKRIHKITKKGLDPDGYNKEGFDIKGIHKHTGTKFDPEGFNKYGYDIEGYKRDGFNNKGYNREGFDRGGFNKEGIHKDTGTLFNPDGYNKKGLDKDGYNEDGYNKDGYDREGYTAAGYDKLGISREGINRKTGEKDERIIFAEEFIASKSTIEQFAREKQMSVEEVNSRIAQIRHSICVKEGIDNLLTGNSNRYLGTLNTKKEQLLSGKVTVRDVRGIDAILKLCDMEETEKITGMLVRELTAHDISILDYQKILGIKELGSGLPSAIVEKLEYFNGMVKRSNNPQIRMAAREMHAEISRVREYRTPYRANEGEALGYFANPTDKEPTVVSITDEHREMAREYLHATDEFICNKTMTATLMKLVRGDLDAEKITRAKKEKELRGLQQEDKELDDTLSMAEQVIENRENNGNEQRS